MKIQFLGEESAALGFHLSGVLCVKNLAELDYQADLWLIADSLAADFSDWLLSVPSPPLFLLLPPWHSQALPELWLTKIAKGLGLSLASESDAGGLPCP